MNKLVVVIATVAFASSVFAAGGRETKDTRGTRENKEAVKAAQTSLDTAKGEAALNAKVDEVLAKYQINMTSSELMEIVKKMEAYNKEETLKKFQDQLISLNSSSKDSEQRYFRSIIALIGKAKEFGLESKAGQALLTLVNNAGSLIELQGESGQRANSYMLSLAYAVRDGKNPKDQSKIESSNSEDLVNKASDLAIEFVYGKDAEAKKKEVREKCLGAV